MIEALEKDRRTAEKKRDAQRRGERRVVAGTERYASSLQDFFQSNSYIVHILFRPSLSLLLHMPRNERASK